MIVRRDMETWIRRQIFVERPEGACTKFVVKHISGSKGGNEIASVNIGGASGDDFIQDTINEIENAAHTDAGGLGGTQKYMVYAYFENTDKPLARFPFVEHVSESADESEDGEIESEPPNPRGLTSQLMRHNEAMMRTTIMGVGQIIGTMQRQLAKNAEVIEKLVSEKFENLETMEELLTRKQERDFAVRAEETKQKLIEEAGQKVISLAPILAAKLLGAKGGGGNNTPKDQMLKAFMDSLNQEQFEKIASVLSPEQTALVVELHNAVGDDDKGSGEVK